MSKTIFKEEYLKKASNESGFSVHNLLDKELKSKVDRLAHQGLVKRTVNGQVSNYRVTISGKEWLEQHESKKIKFPASADSFA